MTEIDEQTTEPAPELTANSNIKQALELVEQSAFTDAELDAYDRFWDAVRYENAKVFDSVRNREEGKEEGRAEGEKNKALEIARNLKQYGMSVAEISQMTGLPEEELNKL